MAARALYTLTHNDALADLPWDAALLDDLRPSERSLTLHVPDFKSYTSDAMGGQQAPWPAVSITGAQCALNCDHCRAEILKPMLPATTAQQLWQIAQRAAYDGAGGMLVSGGSNRRNEVDYAPYLDTFARIKTRWPHFKLVCHTALVNRQRARALANAGVDVAMLDIIGSQDTVQQVYHLKRPVEAFAEALMHLCDTTMRVVPHIVIGLHYGYLLGEWRALQWIRQAAIDALVLVVAMPYYAHTKRPYRIPDVHQVGKFLQAAREQLTDTPIYLGCARPGGRYRQQLDAYAVLSGVDGIAHPAEGVVELAIACRDTVQLSDACCSVPLAGQSSLSLSPDVWHARRHQVLVAPPRLERRA